LTRNKYCPVCGSETSKKWNRKEQDFSEKQQSKGMVLRKKTTISILVALVVVSIMVPTVYLQLANQLANKAKYTGELTLVTFSFNTNSPLDMLYLTMKVENGNVDIDKILLYSSDGQTRYQSISVQQDFRSGAFIHKEFILQEGQIAAMNCSFSLLIDYSFGKQWLMGTFG